MVWRRHLLARRTENRENQERSGQENTKGNADDTRLCDKKKKEEYDDTTTTTKYTKKTTTDVERKEDAVAMKTEEKKAQMKGKTCTRIFKCTAAAPPWFVQLKTGLWLAGAQWTRSCRPPTSTPDYSRSGST